MLDEGQKQGYLQYRYINGPEALRFTRELFVIEAPPQPMLFDEVVVFKGESYHRYMMLVFVLEDGCVQRFRWSINPLQLEEILTNMNKLGVDG